MKKLAFLIALTSGVLCLSAQATSVGFSANPADRSVITSASANVPSGSLVWEGVFSSAGSFAYNPALTITANVADLTSMGGFQQFGLNPSNQTSEFSTYTLALSTVFSGTAVGGSVTDNSGTPGSGQNASFFDNKQVYLVIFNGTTVAASTQMGVFTSTSWIFPTNAGGVGDSSTFDTSSTYTVTALGNAGSVANTGGPNSEGTLKLVAGGVPEPSSLVATLLGAGGLIAMLRRRRTA